MSEFVKILGEVRKYKADKKMSMKEEIASITVHTSVDLDAVIDDLKATTHVKEIKVEKGEFEVRI